MNQVLSGNSLHHLEAPLPPLEPPPWKSKLMYQGCMLLSSTELYRNASKAWKRHGFFNEGGKSVEKPKFILRSWSTHVKKNCEIGKAGFEIINNPSKAFGGTRQRSLAQP